MFKKYKKIGLVAAACALLGVSASQAQVLLTFSQVGANVEARFTGSYRFRSDMYKDVVQLDNATPSLSLTSENAYILGSGSFHLYPNHGTVTPTTIVAGSGVPTFFDQQGIFLGFQGGNLLTSGWYVHTTPPDLPETVDVSGLMTFANTTLSALGASDFNNTLAFVGVGSDNGNREIRFTTAPIPEPSTWVLVGFGLMALFYRYQRRNRGA